ncbi:ADP-ribosylation factor-like protein [Legionella brunensis]|uniref:Rho GTPase (Miro-like) n=1 Tax=Legionella brunensis TaxID=29422 RepID=A0A0W0SDK6_9GAMM|nr:ADP-ribosylation factor-like protein [Legionella brunensis]KTC81562.1 Rho GTPase (Miro-like) [Legionella brunensis]
MDSRRIIFMGEAQSGKTQLLCQLCSLPFEEKYRATFAMDFLQLLLDENRSLMLWDNAGEENIINSTFSIFSHNADVGVYCIDLTKIDSGKDVTVEKIQKDLRQFNENNPGKKIILVGTKADLLEEDSVAEKNNKAEMLLNTIQGNFFARVATSAKSNTNITHLMNLLAHFAYEPKLISLRDSLPPTSLLYSAIDNLHQHTQHLPTAKYEAIAKETSALIRKLMANDFEDESAKEKAIEHFTTECGRHLERYPQVMKAVFAIAATAFVTLLAATLGFALGFALGLWSGPGAFITGLLAAETAAISVVAISSTLGLGAGLFTFFKESSAIEAVHNIATEASTFDINQYPTF